MVSVLRVILPVLLAVLLSRAWVAVQNELVNIPIAAPTVQFLRDRYGAERNLTSKETRALYLNLLQEVGIPYQKQLEGAKTTARGLVVACNLLRHRIRLYARYRDIETNPYLLALRDIGVHGLQPMNFQALLDIPVCAFPSLLRFTEETVRKNAILVVMSQASEVTPLTLLKAVGQRCRDKKPAIRTVAVQQLSSYYATLITRGPAVAWIPNDILHIYNLDDGTNQLAVEGALHTMIASSERFESFCGLLDDVSISIVQEIFSKMSRLRLVVAKLFSIRGAQEHRDVADKLIAFLQKNIPRGVGGEWLSILNVKETRVFKDFSTKSTQWDHMQEVAKWIKTQSKKEAGDYFEREVLWRITLPLSVTCMLSWA